MKTFHRLHCERFTQFHTMRRYYQYGSVVIFFSRGHLRYCGNKNPTGSKSIYTVNRNSKRNAFMWLTGQLWPKMPFIANFFGTFCSYSLCNHNIVHAAVSQLYLISSPGTFWLARQVCGKWCYWACSLGPLRRKSKTFLAFALGEQLQWGGHLGS